MPYITKIHIIFTEIKLNSNHPCITCIPLVDTWKYYTDNQMDCAVIISQSPILISLCKRLIYIECMFKLCMEVIENLEKNK